MPVIVNVFACLEMCIVNVALSLDGTPFRLRVAFLEMRHVAVRVLPSQTPVVKPPKVCNAFSDGADGRPSRS
jgi:hypothetical protein